MAGLLAAAGARVLVAAGPEFGTGPVERLAELRDGSPLETVLLLRPDDATGPAPALPEVAGLRIEWLHATAAEEPDDRLTAPAPRPEDLAAYFHTGGTTGTPEAGRAHARQRGRHARGRSPSPSTGMGEGSMFAALPLFHVNALLVTGLAPLFAGRARCGPRRPVTGSRGCWRHSGGSRAVPDRRTCPPSPRCTPRSRRCRSTPTSRACASPSWAPRRSRPPSARDFAAAPGVGLLEGYG